MNTLARRSLAMSVLLAVLLAAVTVRGAAPDWTSDPAAAETRSSKEGIPLVVWTPDDCPSCEIQTERFAMDDGMAWAAAAVPLRQPGKSHDEASFTIRAPQQDTPILRLVGPLPTALLALATQRAAQIAAGDRVGDRTWTPDSTAEYLAEKMKAPDRVSQMRGRAGLDALGDKAVPSLVHMFWTTEDFGTRTICIEILGLIGSPRAGGDLAVLARIDDAGLRASAIQALALCDTTLASAVAGDAVRDPDPDFRRIAFQVAGQVKARDAVGPLVEVVKTERGGIRLDALVALGGIGDTSAVPAIIPLLAEGDAGLVRHAVICLGFLQDTRAAPGIHAIVVNRHAPWDLRHAALHAIEKIRAPESATFLLEVLRGEDDEIRIHVADTLGELEVVEAVEPLKELLADAHNGKSRYILLRALTMILKEEAMPILEEYRDDPSLLAKAGVLQGLVDLKRQTQEDMEFIRRLAQTAVNPHAGADAIEARQVAIALLGKAGADDDMGILVGLMNPPTSDAATAAANALCDRTGRSDRLTPEQSPMDRERTAQGWQRWWLEFQMERAKSGK